MANCRGSAKSLRTVARFTCTWDQVNLFHQLIETKIRKLLRDELVVQRNERQPILSIKPQQVANLFGAEHTLTVVDDNVCVGEDPGPREN